MHNVFFLAAVSVLAFTPGALAWGNLGHHTVGYVAMEFVNPKTLKNVRALIGPEFNHSLGPAASQPDVIKKTVPEYKFSSVLHYIDALDNPPDQCSVNVTRDCPEEGCIITAIQNYTQQITDMSLNETLRRQALIFVTHFLGDIGQPLHIENRAVGGNTINATCNGASTNLHAVYDGMLSTSVGTRYNGSETTYAAALVHKLKWGKYAFQTPQWLHCISPAALKSTDCISVWARESNQFNCVDVWDFEAGEDLCTGAYVDTAIPIIDMQIAKQGRRLAAWLDAVFKDC
ncbi:nuclease Le1 [Amylostereum chailletii]|nr:nuclease Le1 [Amylostereum chailletii]